MADQDQVTLNEFAKSVSKIYKKAFTSTKPDRKILDSLKNKLELSYSSIANELDNLINILQSPDDKISSLVKAYESHLQGLTVEDLKQAREGLQQVSAKEEEGSFKTLREKTTKFIKDSLPNLPEDKKAALAKILQLGHTRGVYSFKLVDELRILGRAGAVQKSLRDTGFISASNKQKRIEFLISSIVDLSSSKQLINIFGRDITNSKELVNLLKDIYSGKITEDALFAKLKELDKDGRVKSSSVNDYIEYIQFKGKYQLFSTLEKNATKNNVKVSLSIENAIDNIIKGNIISALSRAGNNIMLNNIRTYYGDKEYSKLRKEIQTLIFADKEIVDSLAGLVSSKTFNDLVADQVINTILGKNIEVYNQKKRVLIQGDLETTKIKVDSSKPRNKLKKLNTTLNKPKSVQSRVRNLRGQFTSVVSIEALIRMSLYETIKKNMVEPALVFRSGRFAASVQLQKLNAQRDGSLVAFLTYMKYPYGTYEPGFAHGSVERSPTLLIDRSVREIAAKLITNRLKTIVV